MITAVVIGKENADFACALCQMLEKFGGALFLSPDCILDYSAIAPDFLIFNTEHVEKITSSHSVLLLGAQDAPTHIAKSCRFDCVITDGGQNPFGESPILSVGMRQDSHISIASMEQNAYSVSIQKPLRTLDGKEILPCEFCVECAGSSTPQTMLYAFTLLLLAGKADMTTLKIKL